MDENKKEVLAQCNAALKWYEKKLKENPNDEDAKAEVERIKKLKAQLEK